MFRLPARAARLTILLPILLASLLLLAACGEEKPVEVPDVFRVKFETTEGDFLVEAHKDWAPRGVDRFYDLVNMRYFDKGRFFRVVPGFIAQFGVHWDYTVHARWRQIFITDDPPVMENKRGTLSFAQSGPNTRTTEIFINLKDNPELDEQGFVPFAEVAEGMDVVDNLYSGYGELKPVGKYIDPGRVEENGNAYLEERFPELDWIKSATFVEPGQ